MSEHYTDGRRWSYISQAWIFADGWNDREEIARLQAKVRELEERLTTLKQQRIKYGPICLVCGAAEPCHLKDDPHSPCTFDPAPRELWDRCKDLEGKLAASERMESVVKGCEIAVLEDATKEELYKHCLFLMGKMNSLEQERDQVRARVWDEAADRVGPHDDLYLEWRLKAKMLREGGRDVQGR